MSWQASAISSEIRRPVWIVSASVAWSRRPLQVAWVAGGEQRVDLRLGEIGEQVALGLLRRDREHPLDRGGVLGVLQGEVGEQRVDRREPVVAGLRRVAAVVFEVL
jgi:hypothetical protein